MSSQIYKARIALKPTPEACESLKAAGFDGLEARAGGVAVEEARTIRQMVESFGLRIHSTFGGGARFDSKDPAVQAKGVEAIENSIRAAAAFGADTVLLVPARLDGLKMPDPWDFDVDFDAKTLAVKTVTQGDNGPYAEYIAAHNFVTESVLRNVEKLIPTAAREGVRIGLENVWNNLWCDPKFFAALVRYFDNPWIGAYFDLGNHVKYSRCENWIDALGTKIVKLHIKGYRVSEFKGRHGGGSGDWVKIDQASIDWSAVRRKLADVPYNGWLTIEEGGYSDQKYSEILDRFIAGRLTNGQH